jgi:uncharacterized protein YbgA (DUF1722 family)/uncharacterized protein YbbK (DUF523 family)
MSKPPESGMADAIKIGVSTCLLGEKVRYDGGHKLCRYLTEVLGPWFSFVAVCPEVGCGLPVPREAMRLEGDPAAPRLVTIESGVDLTRQLLDYCRRTVVELEAEELCGFVFKKGSPSCGLFRVTVYARGMPARTGRGLFARAVVEHFPLLPVEEEGRLEDAGRRENFLERVFAYGRLRDFLREDASPGGLMAFHARHKLQLMAHHPALCRELGRLVAGAGGVERDVCLEGYARLFMAALGYQATARKHADVMRHILGYFKKELAGDEKKELLDVVAQYRRQLVPLVVPLTLLKHYARKFDHPYLMEQTYLEPHPAELMLRNHLQAP